MCSPPPIGTSVPIIGNGGVVRLSGAEDSVIQAPLYGAAVAEEPAEPPTQMEIEEEAIVAVSEQDKTVP
eukprot:7816883-Lingulodinium_polyedra.AAC.1